MRRRLEASWHKTTKPCDLTATVNDAVVQRKLMFLFGEICLTGRSVKYQKGLLVDQKSRHAGIIDRSERTRWKPIAPAGVTLRVIKQKSADGIVAQRPV